MKIGKKIKERRKEMKLSLRDLAKRVDLTASFLSQVERDQASPSIDSLRKISRALDVPAFYFLLEQDGPNPVVRRDQRRKMSLPEGIVTYYLLTPDVNRKLGVTLAELEPNATGAPLVKFEHTEECIYLLAGALEVKLGAETHQLNAGDAIYFDGPMLQRLRALGDQKATYLSIVTPPIF